MRPAKKSERILITTNTIFVFSLVVFIHLHDGSPAEIIFSSIMLIGSAVGLLGGYLNYRVSKKK